MERLPNPTNLVSPILKTRLKAKSPLSHSQIEAGVIIELAIPETLSSVKRSGNRRELSYRLSWARTAAKNQGLIERNTEGLWQITEKGKVGL